MSLAAGACGDNGLQVVQLASATRRRLRRLRPAGAVLTGPVDSTAAVTTEPFRACLEAIAADDREHKAADDGEREGDREPGQWTGHDREGPALVVVAWLVPAPDGGAGLSQLRQMSRCTGMRRGMSRRPGMNGTSSSRIVARPVM
jgi:hypothetical protein